MAADTTVRLADTMFVTSNLNELTAQFRYRQTPFAVSLEKQGDDFVVAPHTPVEKPALGQSCVLYKDAWCVGGGIIAE